MASIEWRSENTCRLVAYRPKTSASGYEKATKTITFPDDMTSCDIPCCIG